MVAIIVVLRQMIADREPYIAGRFVDGSEVDFICVID